MSDDLDKQIERIEGRVGQLRGDIRDAEKARDDLYVLRSKRDYGIEAGMKVRDRKGEGIVLSVRPNSYARSKPWTTVNRIKKDGTPSQREEHMYGDWELVKP